MCVGDSVWLGWSGIRVAGWSTTVLQPATRIPLQPNHTESPTLRTKNNTTNVVIWQNSRKLLMMDILMSETFWAHKKWNKIASDIKLVFYSSTITMMHGPINISLKRKVGKICARYSKIFNPFQKRPHWLKLWKYSKENRHLWVNKTFISAQLLNHLRLVYIGGLNFLT